MDDQRQTQLEPVDDMPFMLAMIGFVGLWGFITSVAAVFSASLGH